jgi:hypothetical protein
MLRLAHALPARATRLTTHKGRVVCPQSSLHTTKWSSPLATHPGLDSSEQECWIAVHGDPEAD